MCWYLDLHFYAGAFGDAGEALTDSDYVFVGPTAKAWCSLIGRYGDPLRTMLVNKLVARMLNHFGGEGGRGRIAKPHTLIQQFIAALPSGMQVPRGLELAKAHEDTARLAAEFPFIAGTSLLDLGSGNAYLGGWLSALGVRYTGVELSADLHKAAQDDGRLAEASLFQDSIRRFLEGYCSPHATAPTLISIIAVVDHLADPAASLGALFDLMARREWLNVPVLVATFDPDFFLPGLPVRGFVRQPSTFLAENLSIRDPALWEEMFVNCGFHVLEQRPLHISGLPAALSSHLQELHKHQFERNPSELGGREARGKPITGARVPPRQGPLYFWLLSPRKVDIERQATVPEGATATKVGRVESFAQDEVLSVVGNLGPRVYRLTKGSAFFDSPETGLMRFGEGSSFGQMEVLCNYVSSRVLGELTACAGTRIETTESLQVLRALENSRHFSDELFLSLLRHLESVQFKAFVSTKRTDGKVSKVLTGKTYDWLFVRNMDTSEIPDFRAA
jgi:hypothetical protein